MNCNDSRPLLSAYIDGEATPEERKKVERHLAVCDDCRAVLAEYRAIGGDLRAMPLPMPPAGLRRDVWRAIEAKQGAGSRIAVAPPTSKGKLAALPRQSGWAGAGVFAKVGNGWARAVPAALLVGALLIVMSVIITRGLAPVGAVQLEEKGEIAAYGRPVHLLFSKYVDPDDAVKYTEVMKAEQPAGDKAYAPVAVTKTYQMLSSTTGKLTIEAAGGWKPGASYKVVVDAAKIRREVGSERLGDAPIELTFAAAANTPTPTNTPSSTPTPTNTDTPTAVPTHTPQPTAVAGLDVTPGAVTTLTLSPVQAEPSPSGAVATAAVHATATANAGATSAVPSSTPTHTGGTQPPATSTPLPRPTFTNTAVPVVEPSSTPQPSATPRPEPSATPTAVSTVEATATARPSATPVPTEPVATATATVVRKGTPTPGSTATPKVTPGKGSPTPTVQVATGTPTATPNGCSVTPVRGFGKLWSENAALRQRVGCATKQEETVEPTAQQHFENGYMFWRGDTRTIYVFTGQPSNRYGVWQAYPDTWQEGEPIPPTGGTPPVGKYAPVRGFGKLWATNESVRAALGWATQPETSVGSVWQQFERGSGLWTDDRTIRFLYEDGIWERFDDTYKE